MFGIDAFATKFPGEDARYPYGNASIAVSYNDGHITRTIYLGQISFAEKSEGCFEFVDSQQSLNSISFSCIAR
jgi:hypothetical protein